MVVNEPRKPSKPGQTDRQTDVFLSKSAEPHHCAKPSYDSYVCVHAIPSYSEIVSENHPIQHGKIK
jgi:hypothetical protein